MAECSLARCIQERRLFRKEFQRWNKDMLLVVGLERVAEEIMGPRRWSRLVEPLKAIEGELETTDWQPDESCYFCDSKRMPPYDPAGGLLPVGYGSFKSFQMDIDGMLSSPETAKQLMQNGAASWRSVLAASMNGRETATAAAAVAFLAASAAASAGTAGALENGDNNCSEGESADDQPLDLSLSSASPTKASTPDVYDTATITINAVASAPTTASNKTTKAGNGVKKKGETNAGGGGSAVKRSYTEDELQAALRDIQSGKLGTRRAAVIYGIPRSTLRNKVYKLANDRRKATSPLKDANSAAKVISTPSAATVVAEEPCGAAALPNGDVSSTDSPLPPDDSPSGESLRQLLKTAIKKKSTPATTTGTPAVSPTSPTPPGGSSEHLLSSIEYANHSLGPLFSQFLASIQQLAMNPLSAKMAAAALGTQGSNVAAAAAAMAAFEAERGGNGKFVDSVLPDLIRHLAQERFNEERSRLQRGGAAAACQDFAAVSPVTAVTAAADAAASAFPLRVSPVTAAATPFHSAASSNIDSPSLKDLIAKSITQRNGSASNGVAAASVTNGAIASSPAVVSAATTKTKSKAAASAAADSKAVAANNGSAADNGEKKSRPKRGRYRNYNRDNLIMAVRAVQRGEMSVHRAGTFYGVPHSTLEYKVKERHLLRPKKRQQQQQQPDGVTTANGNTTPAVGESDETAPPPAKRLPPSLELSNATSTALRTPTALTDWSNDSRLSNGSSKDTNASVGGGGGVAPGSGSLWGAAGANPLLGATADSLSLPAAGGPFFASDMMRRLQAESNNNNNSSSFASKDVKDDEDNKKDSKAAMSGLLETLIRTTLDKEIKNNSNNNKKKNTTASVVDKTKTTTAVDDDDDDTIDDDDDDEGRLRVIVESNSPSPLSTEGDSMVEVN